LLTYVLAAFADDFWKGENGTGKGNENKLDLFTLTAQWGLSFNAYYGGRNKEDDFRPSS